MANQFTLTADSPTFVPSDVGNAYDITFAGVIYRCNIIEYISALQVLVEPESELPDDFNGSSTSDWARCVDEFSGLTWLEGETVKILAGGGTVPDQVVTGGAITLDRPESVVIIGLPYEGLMETLDIEPVQGTQEGMKKQVIGAYLGVSSSREFKVGTDEQHLREAKIRTTEPYGSPTDRITGVVEVLTSGVWNNDGRVVVKQDLPLPLSILSLAPIYRTGGK
jgi:hypothetical protein